MYIFMRKLKSYARLIYMMITSYFFLSHVFVVSFIVISFLYIFADYLMLRCFIQLSQNKYH